jgi:hypothetical protein
MPSFKSENLKARSYGKALAVSLFGSKMLVLWCVACGTPPKAGMEVRVTSGGPKAATICPAPSPGVAPSPGCEPFELTDTSKLVVKPGDAVALTGKNFRSSLTVASNELADGTAPKVTVISDTKAALLVPDKASFGLMNLTLAQDGVTQKVTLLSNGGKTDYPIFTAGADHIVTSHFRLTGTGRLFERYSDWRWNILAFF